MYFFLLYVTNGCIHSGNGHVIITEMQVETFFELDETRPTSPDSYPDHFGKLWRDTGGTKVRLPELARLLSGLGIWIG